MRSRSTDSLRPSASPAFEPARANGASSAASASARTALRPKAAASRASSVPVAGRAMAQMVARMRSAGHSCAYDQRASGAPPMPVDPPSRPDALIASTVQGAATRARGAGRTTCSTTSAPSTTAPAACRARSGLTATTARRPSTPSIMAGMVIASGHRRSRACTEARNRSTPLAICTIMAELERTIACSGGKPVRWSSGIASSARPKPTVACRAEAAATMAAAAATTGSGCPSSMGIGFCRDARPSGLSPRPGTRRRCIRATSGVTGRRCARRAPRAQAQPRPRSMPRRRPGPGTRRSRRGATPGRGR